MLGIVTSRTSARRTQPPPGLPRFNRASPLYPAILGVYWPVSPGLGWRWVSKAPSEIDIDLVSLGGVTPTTVRPLLGVPTTDFAAATANDYIAHLGAAISATSVLNPTDVALCAWCRTDDNTRALQVIANKPFTSHVAPFYQYTLRLGAQAGVNGRIAGWITTGASTQNAFITTVQAVASGEEALVGIRYQITGGMSAWCNGISLPVTAEVGSLTPAAAMAAFASGIAIGRLGNVDASSRFDGAIGPVLVMNGTVTTDAMMWMLYDPATRWSYLEQPSQTSYFLLGGAGAVGLTVLDSVHGHLAAAPALTQAHVLETQGSAHAHLAAAPDLTQAHVLAVGGSLHAHVAGVASLAEAAQLAVSGALHAHLSGEVPLTQAHALTVEDAAHGHVASAVSLEVAGVLGVGGALHGHLAGAPVLTQAHVLAVQGSAHDHRSGEVTLTQAVVLVPADAVHAHIAGEASLTAGELLEVLDAVHAHLAGGPGLTEHAVLVVSGALHAHLAQQIAFGLSGVEVVSERMMIARNPSTTLIVLR